MKAVWKLIRPALLLAPIVALSGACAATTGHRLCSTSRTRCVILVEEAGAPARVAPPEAIFCEDAKLHAKQIMADAPERKAWVQEILVTDEIDPAKDCLGSKELERSREGVPWQDAVPAR